MKPYAELYPSLGRPGCAAIWGRLVREPDDLDLDSAVPWDQLSEDEIKHADLTLHVGEARFHVQSDAEGYFHLDLDATQALAPGAWAVRASLEPDGPLIEGGASLRLLPEGEGVPVVTSDIDLTWLITPFQSARGKLQLLRQAAAQRAHFPGMPALYRALRRDLLPGQEAPLALLSGSPRFFKRVLEARLRLDQIPCEALLLKGFKDIAWEQLSTLRPHRVQAALREQIGYKLLQLLRQRRALPAHTPEVLLGDDSEADFITYALYREIQSGATPPGEPLLAELTRLRVPAAQRPLLVEEALLTRAHVRGQSQLLFVGIRQTGAAPREDAAPWLERAQATLHADTAALASALHARGLINADSLEDVLREASAPDLR
jgi:hypothetical protein